MKYRVCTKEYKVPLSVGHGTHIQVCNTLDQILDLIDLDGILLYIEVLDDNDKVVRTISDYKKIEKFIEVNNEK